MRLNRVVEALAEWHAAAADRARRRALLRHTVLRMGHLRLAAGFGGWRAAAAARREKRETLQVGALCKV